MSDRVDNGFSKDLHFGPHNANTRADDSVKLVTYDLNQHMNVIVKAEKKTSYSGITREVANLCLSADQAKSLRDALLEAYPLPGSGDKRIDECLNRIASIENRFEKLKDI